MTSIRSAITRSTSAVVFVVVAFLCIAGFFYLRSFQIQAFQDAIEHDLRVVGNSVEVWTDGDVYIEMDSGLLVDFSENGANAFVVHDETGYEVIEQSISLDAANRVLNAGAGAKYDEPVWTRDIGPNGAPAMVATTILPARWGWDFDDPSIEVSDEVQQTKVQITVSHDRTPLDATLRNWALIGLAMTLVAAMSAGAAVWFSTGRALRPLDELADRAKQIDEPTDDAPFDINGPKELRPIADRLNNLLARLKSASLSERRFTADAAHELRTPIAELRTLTDVALAFPSDPERMNSVVRTANELSIRLSSLVDALLGIARRETIKGDLRSDPVNVPMLLQQIVDDKGAAISSKRLKVNYGGPHEHVLETDAALLTSTLNNLIGNAVSYTPIDTTIEVSYSGGSSGFRLDISNPAPDLTQADVDMLFEPFWRKGGAQSDRSHSGLGLTLSKNFSKLLNFDLEANLLTSGDIQFTLASQ